MATKARHQEHRKRKPDECTHAAWTHTLDAHTFVNAEEYLTLIFPDPDAKAYRKLFEQQQDQLVHRKSRDIFRAARLDAMVDDIDVAGAVEAANLGARLQPLLLIRGNYQKPLVIADGYHRLCASIHLQDHERIPCVLL